MINVNNFPLEMKFPKDSFGGWGCLLPHLSQCFVCLPSFLTKDVCNSRAYNKSDSLCPHPHLPNNEYTFRANTLQIHRVLCKYEGYVMRKSSLQNRDPETNLTERVKNRDEKCFHCVFNDWTNMFWYQFQSVGFFSHTTKEFLDTSGMFYNST